MSFLRATSILAAAMVLLRIPAAAAQDAPPVGDGDRDGLDDAFEQALLLRFSPSWIVAEGDCDGLPAEFLPGSPEPRPIAKNGTIYGQVFPVERAGVPGAFLEIHYYHLWANDCGRLGHAFDTECVSALVQADRWGETPEAWRAVYWYAAAHEGTICDVSTVARASRLGAQHRGPSIWVSAGKHASFLSLDMCRKLGCGGDRCEGMKALPPREPINLGEPGFPLHGAVWVESSIWSLAEKMTPNFDEVLIARIETHERGNINRVQAAPAPVHAVILAGDSTLYGLGLGNRHAGEALSAAESETDNALGKAFTQTGKALRRAGRAVTGWFRKKTP